MATIDQLKAAFTKGLGVSESAIDWDSLEYRSIPQWDSLAHMAVVAEIEDSFDIMLEVEDVVGMSSFVVAQDILGKYGVELS